MRPRVVFHVAACLDGRVDWFSPDLELFYGVAGQWAEDATLTGADTILASSGKVEDAVGPAVEEDVEPVAVAVESGRETAVPAQRPLLAVVDSEGRVRDWLALRHTGYWRDVVALCSWKTPQEYLDQLRRLGVSAVVAGEDRVDLEQALEVLAERFHVQLVRVDSGGALAGALLRRGLIDEVSVLVHPCLVGGTTPCTFFRAEDLTSAQGVIALSLKSVETLQGGVVWLRYEVEHRGS
ncbi:MAG: 2,5-diamino-6-ribosylamino-4(3H)-pyrimidinone 5'-phosphate reductase [Actinobacteria bacterium ADurb.Bin444]|nr:MAG: 2,5-diamino-6-ribosylamino-4(3H)-pyrimidinone 5'-phosphate reductase [Actinobacteria bacterium ADurb.Bin444]